MPHTTSLLALFALLASGCVMSEGKTGFFGSPSGKKGNDVPGSGPVPQQEASGSDRGGDGDDRGDDGGRDGGDNEPGGKTGSGRPLWSGPSGVTIWHNSEECRGGWQSGPALTLDAGVCVVADAASR